MSENQQKIQRNFWEKPWGYVESFLIGTGLIFVGFSIEYFVPNAVENSLVFPYNTIFLVGYIFLLFLLYKKDDSNPLINWFTKVPATISSIFLLTLLVMLMGIIPQVPTKNFWVQRLGLNHMTSNWAFLCIVFQLLTCLGFVTIKRIAQFKWNNTGFILNHLGLFLILAIGFIGRGDMQRLRVTTNEGQLSRMGVDENKNQVELPFGLFLKSFTIDQYPPKLALVNLNTGDVANKQSENLYLIEKGGQYTFDHLEVTVDNHLPSAGKIGSKYEAVNEEGSPPAAFIRVKNNENDSILKGWISCGSYRYPYEYIKINDAYAIVMTIPEIKRYRSEIEIVIPNEPVINTLLEVNKPFNYRGWKIYQLDYDEKKGKWSKKSVLELVKDPWLPFIYVGVFMMTLGAVFMFWTGNKITNKD